MLEPQASRDNLLYQTFFTVSKLNSQLQESEAKVQSASLSVEGKVDR
jgi:division protein CdvB (Snf7/Vps24/ESCRT-III family)